MRKKKVLITGAVSLIGKYFSKEYKKSFDLVLAAHQKPIVERPSLPALFLDITDKTQVEKLIQKTKPDVLIHLAALSNIDYCQIHPDMAQLVNVEGTRNIIEALQGSDCHLLFLSSNAVFDGTSPFFKESDLPHPLNVYGQTKMAAEQIILKSDLVSTIIRSAQAFGWPPTGGRDNDVTYYLSQLKKGKTLHLVNDRFFNPIYALRIVQLLTICIQKKAAGLFHIGSNDRVNRYTFVKLLTQVWQLPQVTLTSVPSTYFPHLAPRPPRSYLSTQKIEQKFGISPFSLESDLSLMRDEII